MSDTDNKDFAVIKTSGKQYKVQAGDRIRIPSLKAEVDTTVKFSEVLLKGKQGGDVTVGSPLLEGASVAAKVVAHGKDKKIIVFKKKRRKGYRKKQGHRQGFTEVLIENIA